MCSNIWCSFFSGVLFLVLFNFNLLFVLADIYANEEGRRSWNKGTGEKRGGEKNIARFGKLWTGLEIFGLDYHQLQ